MSPEKLLKTLASILKDFSPWTGGKSHYWFGMGPSHIVLSAEQQAILQPFSIFLAFVTFCDFPFHGRSEKIEWSIPVKFKSIPLSISSQKFGLRFYIPSGYDFSPEIGDQLVGRLLHAVKIVDALMKPFSAEQIATGNVSISNKFHLHRGRYEFFREQADQSFKSAAGHEAAWRAGDFRTQEFANNWNRASGDSRKAYYYSTAALDGYFSYLEHLLVLLLPFCGFDVTGDNLLAFLNMSWGDKWKRIFSMGRDLEAEQAYHQLVKVKQRFRNPLAHGGFDPEGEAVFIHVHGIGAIPATMSKFKDSIHYGFNPIRSEDFVDICATLDAVDKFLQSCRLRLAFRCVSSGVNVAFDASAIAEYEKAMIAEENMDRFIDGSLQQMDNAANMDW